MEIILHGTIGNKERKVRDTEETSERGSVEC